MVSWHLHITASSHCSPGAVVAEFVDDRRLSDLDVDAA